MQQNISKACFVLGLFNKHSPPETQGLNASTSWEVIAEGQIGQPCCGVINSAPGHQRSAIICLTDWPLGSVNHGVPLTSLCLICPHQSLLS